MPFMMDKLHASSTLISIFLITIPALMNFALNPIISTKSDRYRSKWGRRIPFLVFSAPFITIFLVLAGFSAEIGTWLHAHVLSYMGISKDVIILSLLGVVLVAYRFFNFFVTTVFYYLFNDVVPEHFMGRFTTGFRAFATIATFTYQWFVFRYAEHNARWIFLGVGLFYLVGFTLMCLKVKEGEYPPPPEKIGKKDGISASINTYIRECFSHKIYVTYFMVWGLLGLASCSNPFLLLMMQKSLGISMWQIGHLTGIGAVASFVVLYPAGVLSDKYHPIRVFLYSYIAQSLVALLYAIVIIGLKFPQPAAYKIVLGYTVLSAPFGAIAATAIFPLCMRLMPRSRYGQFSSAAAMVNSLFIVLGGFAIGLLLDSAKHILHGSSVYLRYAALWLPAASFFVLIFTVALFGMWKKLGGDESYSPPDPRQHLAAGIDA